MKKQVIPASDVQNGMAFYSQFNENCSLYVTQVEVCCEHNFSLPFLKKAWDLLSEECLLLRSYYDDKQFIVEENIDLDITFHDLSKKINPDNQYALLKSEDLNKKIQIEIAPLYRIMLVKLDDDKSYLLWSHHHILFDASSFTRVIDRLFEIYNVLLSNGNYQKKYLDSHVQINSHTDKEYWKDLLKNPNGSNLCNISLANQLACYKPYQEKFTLLEGNKTSLSMICTGQGLTLNALLQSCWGVLLAKYTGKDDAVFGTVRAYPRSLTQDKAGLFINTLPVRVSFQEESYFFDLVKEVRAQHEKIRDYVGHSLQEICQLTELPSDYALFDTVIDFKQGSVEGLINETPAGCVISVNFIVNTNYPLLLELVDEGARINARITYNQALFTKDFVQDLINSYLILINQVCEKANFQLRDIQYLSARQLEKIKYELNDTNHPLNNKQYLYSPFEKSAEAFGNKFAVISSCKNLSYEETNIRANKIAHKLRELGSNPNELVAIVMEKGWEEVVATLGVMKAGSAYLPISADFPQQRIKQLLKQGKVKFVLTQSHYLNSIKWPEDIQVFAVDRDAVWENYSTNNLTPIQELTDLAYVIFTSGSTGTPKGVMIDHLGAMNTIADINSRFNVTADDVILGLSALNFDLSVYDLFGVLGAGGTLVLPAEEDRKEPAAWLRLLCEHQITLWNSVPALMHMLVEYARSQAQIENTSHLRLILLSGDWIELDLPARIKELCGSGTQVISLGGATEASIWSILYPIESVETSWRSIPYGRPMWNQQFYILDAHAQLLPQGVRGELYIGGVGVAKGYWNDEERTKKSFIHHPELGYLYKTGDLGCCAENGLIEFLGRADHQVKIRGYRIELEEIEVLIKKLEDLKEVIVQVKKNSAQEDVLIAYYVSFQVADVNQLKEKIRNHLPSYMVPDIYIRLDALPLSANGKVDYKNLPSISNASLAKTIRHLPNTKEECLLSEIWRSVLSQDLIDIDDNFFDLGGHSLSALQCVTRLKAYGIEIPIRFIFSNPTIRSLAKMIVYNKNHSVSLNNSSLVKSEVYFPLTSAQKRIWFISHLVDDKPLYNITFAFKFSTQLNIEKLDQAFNKVVKKHASFRLSFSKDLEVMQKMNKEVSFKVNLINNTDRHCAIEELISEHNNTIFNLLLAPLMKVSLLKSCHENILIITVHHLIFDGLSMNLMMKDLNAFYCNEKLNPENMTVDYSSYAINEEKTFLESNLSYWQNLLGSSQEELFHLPVMHSRPAVSSFNGKTHYFYYYDHNQKLSSLAKKNHASVSTVLLTALFSLLKQYGHVGALNIGMPVSMRNESNLEDIIGCFVNTLIVKMQADESTNFEELVSTVQKQIFESLEHKNFSYEKLINELNVERNADHNPLFQILFSYQKVESNTNKLFNSHFEEIPISYQTAKFDLTLFAFDQHDGNILCSFEYNTDLFDEVLIKNLADHYCNLLNFISTQSTSIAQLEFLSVEEKELQTISWNSTSKRLDNQCYLYDNFEKSAAQYPDKTAIISARGSISYQELNRKANCVAHKLRDLGCQPNELIAVVMEKGWEEACAALVIMKAGSAYLPISADFPHQRIGQLLEQGKVRFVLTQGDYINAIPWPNHIQAFSLNDDAAWAGYPSNNLKPIQLLSDLAYVIFTSGSTGIPKGVMLNHLSVMNTIADINTRFKVTSNDTILGLSALNFDLSVYDLFGVLGVGGTLVLPAEADRKDPSVWLSLIAQHKVTLWNTVPALMQMLSDYVQVQNEDSTLQTIRLILLSGDWIPVNLPNQIKKLCGPDTTIISLGGATEGSIWSVLYAIDAVDSSWRNIPYGRPMWNQEIYVLNEQQKLQAVGVPGELYIGGVGVAKGYWNDPIRTEKSFIHHPDLGYLYRTGDTGRYTNKGVIEFLGRIDQQVKIRGYRIELEEVESALLSFPNIKNVVAVVAEDENKKQLAAYFTSFSIIDLNNLKNYLSEKLPSYMMPEAFIPIEVMPLSANGKIDIKALPKINFENSRSIAYQKPETQVERALAEVWASLLKVKKIGKNDNFFELGGNSLSSTQLLITIKKRFLVNIPLRIIFQSRTLKELAFQIEKLLSIHKKEEIGELCYI